MSRIDLYPNTKASPSTAAPATGTAVTGDKFAQDVYIQGGGVTGTITPSGLTIAIRNTTMDVTDVATPLPASALAQRNSMTVDNYGTDPLYVGPATVTADSVVGTTSGRRINVGESFNLDIRDSIVLYGIAPAGKTIRVLITELA